MACDVLYKLRYEECVVAPLGACVVIHDGNHNGRHLGNYKNLEIIKKRLKMNVFPDRHVEYDITKQCTTFYYL